MAKAAYKSKEVPSNTHAHAVKSFKLLIIEICKCSAEAEYLKSQRLESRIQKGLEARI